MYKSILNLGLEEWKRIEENINYWIYDFSRESLWIIIIDILDINYRRELTQFK
jgi:hypothetical protein